MVPQVKSSLFFDKEVADKIRTSPGILIAPGGGIGGFGANFTVFSYQGKTYWFDLGIGFSDRHTPGLYKKLPDPLLASSTVPDAVFLTHGHEDHIGAVPYFYEMLPEGLEFFGSAYTLALLRSKIKDAGGKVEKFEYQIVEKNKVLKFDKVNFHFFFHPHSIPQVFSLGVEIPSAGIKFYWSADFKTEGKEDRFSRKDIEDFGPIDYFFSDSTGALSDGLAPAETEVGENLYRVIADWPGRVFITTFSSQVERIKSILEAARLLSREVGFQGYSIKNHLRAAYEAKEFDIPSHQLSDPSPKSRKAIWIVAGCQSEEGSSFYRLAHDEIKKFSLRETDLLIYASSMIPGNESQIWEALNLIARKGVHIVGIDGQDPRVHASGHGRKEDIRRLVQWLKPQTIVPIHGDPIHFRAFENSGFAEESGARVDYMERGNIYDLRKHLTSVKRFNPVTGFLEYGEIHTDETLYYRRLELSDSGVCTVVVRESDLTLLALNFTGVSSSNFISDRMDEIRSSIQQMLDVYDSPLSRQKTKKLREKIQAVNAKHLAKNPFVNLVMV